MKTSKMLVLLMVALPLVLSTLTSASTLAEREINNLNNLGTHQQLTVNQIKAETRQFPYNSFMLPLPAIHTPLPGCPLCDSSVYTYCSRKLLHDSCCCDFAGAAFYQIPPQCAYNNCKVLYAKSCHEYSLIKNCCCNNPN